MSFGGAEKEFIFHLWLKTRKERLEQIVRVRFSNIQLEQPIDALYDQSGSGNGRKKKPVDMYAMDTLGMPVLVESVLARSNGAHQETLRQLVDYLSTSTGGQVIYQAFSFQEKHVKELRNLVERSLKPVCLYLVELNTTLLVPLTKLDGMNKLDVWDNLSLVDSVPKPLYLVERIASPVFTAVEPLSISNTANDYTASREDSNQFLIRELERCIPEFFPFHRAKSHTSPIITFGGGSSDLMYHCSVCDSRGLAFVELRFGNREDLYLLMSSKPMLLQTKIDRRVYARNSTIGVQFRASSDQRANVRGIVRIFRAMIENVSRPLYDLLTFEHEVKIIWKGRTA